jgi:outer membrane protein assembly factor BamB
MSMFCMSRINNFGLTLALVVGLVACSSGPERPKSADLGANPALLGVRTAWTAKLGAVDFPLEIKANGNFVVLAGSDGTVVSLDARSGVEQWRSNMGGPISAGVGSDGRFAAVVSRQNELIVVDDGREIWRARLAAQIFTAPLVAGGRVFVLGADRNVIAFDVASGRKLWQNQRPGDALVLRQAGILTAVGNTLIAGVSGRLIGLNPLNGNALWDAPLATPRGTNDIERLVDVVSGISREGAVVCARAFQAAVGCVDTSRGSTTWKRLASGAVGLSGDDKFVYGVESDGKVLAWRRNDGEQAWVTDRLLYRQLSTPLVIGRSVAVGDDVGFVHLLSRTDGTLLTRLATDGSAISSAPVLASGTLVVVTRNGGVFGFQPE